MSENEIMWCLSCGTVTDDGGCDCTGWVGEGTGAKQRLTPIWSAKLKEAENIEHYVKSIGKWDDYLNWLKEHPIEYVVEAAPTPPLLSQEEAFQRAVKAGMWNGLVSKPGETI